MSRFFTLFRNEFQKLFARVSTWILLGLVLLLVVGMGGCQKLQESLINSTIASGGYEEDIPSFEDSYSWRSDMQDTLTEIKRMREEPFDSMLNRYRTESELQELDAAAALIQRHLDTDTPPQQAYWLMAFSSPTPVDFMVNSLGSSWLISIFAIVMSVIAVAGEFTRGSIKFLLISPYRRWKILVSKFCAVFVTAAMMLTL